MRNTAPGSPKVTAMTGAQDSRRAATSDGFMRDRLLWFVLALGFVDGAVYNFLPVTFPIFRREFGATLEQMGRVQVMFFVSALVFSLCGGWIIGRLGLRRAGVALLIGLVVSLLGIGKALEFATVLAGAFLFGLCLAGIEVVSNSMISEHFPEKRQSIFFIWGVINAVGAALGPAGLGWWLAHTEGAGQSWRKGYYTVSGIILILIVWGLLLRPKDSSAETLSGRRAAGALHIMKEILSKPTIYGVSLTMFLHGLAQMGMVSWVGQLYQKRLGIDTARAAYFISLNSAGFFVGRSLLSWITARRRVPELLVLGISAAGGTLAFAATIAAPGYVWGLAMFTLAGMFISGDGPSINSYTGLRFAGKSATAFALMNGLGNVGAAAGPYLIGVLGTRLGLEKGIWFMPVFSLGLATVAFVWFLRERGRKNHDLQPSSFG